MASQLNDRRVIQHLAMTGQYGLNDVYIGVPCIIAQTESNIFELDLTILSWSHFKDQPNFYKGQLKISSAIETDSEQYYETCINYT